MKITDVTLTLFAWDDIPPDAIRPATAGSRVRARLGCCASPPTRVVEGHAFLGSASNSATTDGQGLITHLKPVLMGRKPRCIAKRSVVDLWKKQRASGVAPPSARSTWRCGIF